jgi:hypothetical protein
MIFDYLIVVNRRDVDIDVKMVACGLGPCGLGRRRGRVSHANGILVLTLAGDQISVVTGFPDNGPLPVFGLPRTLPG